jgi:hypothetical protein
VFALTNDVCNYKEFPVFAGGEKEEVMKCMDLDPTNNFFIAGGKTQSSDFAPAENYHGYIFALDSNGNWMWGNFFYNVSYAISDVTACKMSSANGLITVLGQANQKPIVMFLNKNDGSINKFITIEPVATTTTAPTYATGQAIYMNEGEVFDGKSYIYVSFTRTLSGNSEMHIVRILNDNPISISWHYTSSYVAATPHFPQFIAPSISEGDQFFWMGQYNGFGSIIKFLNRDAKVEYVTSYS